MRRQTKAKKSRLKALRALSKRARKLIQKSWRKAGGLGRYILRFLGWLLIVSWRFGWRFGLISVLIALFGIGYYFTTLPPVASLIDARARGSVIIYDRHGQSFAWRGDHFAGQVTPDTISPHLKNAIIATEDKRFYRHIGLSPRGIAGAIRINLREGRGAFSGHGGSTLTQQTAKLLCLGVNFDPKLGQSERAFEAKCRETSLWRKIKEAGYALAMELAYSKDEILTIYLNRVFMGAGARGVEAAAQRYFAKPAAYLTPSQSAMLAGLLVAPTRYAPTNNLAGAQKRAGVVLRLMTKQGYLNEGQLQTALASPAELSLAAKRAIGGAYADWIMMSAPDFLTRSTTEDVNIYTTFDPFVQRAAETALSEIFATKVRAGSQAEAAIVVLSRNGAVRAIVGGRDARGIGYNRATQARRQPGSAFKPFVYAAALDAGFSPRARVLDAPISLEVKGSGTWTPRNYDRQWHGMLTLTEALADSLNIPAVILSEAVGRDRVGEIARGFGVKTGDILGPAFALGTSETTLLDLTAAYGGILNAGFQTKPWGIEQIYLQGEKVPLFTGEASLGDRIIAPQAAGQLTYMLRQVIEHGTGQRAILPGRPVAGKTGTTQAARDAWFIGFSADYVTGVWMGYDNNAPLTGVTGGGLPADIWRETMLRIHEGLPVRPLPEALPSGNKSVIRAQNIDGAPRRLNGFEQLLRSIFGE